MSGPSLIKEYRKRGKWWTVSLQHYIVKFGRTLRLCTLKNETIRDRIVVGVRDGVLSEKIQLYPDLTVDKAIPAACRNEAVKQQQAVVRGESAPKGEDLDAIGLKPSGQASYAPENKQRVMQKRFLKKQELQQVWQMPYTFFTTVSSKRCCVL